MTARRTNIIERGWLRETLNRAKKNMKRWHKCHPWLKENPQLQKKSKYV